MRFVTILFILAVLGFVAFKLTHSRKEENKSESFEVTKSEAQWKEELSPQAFQVLRKHATERPNTSSLNKNKADGVYHCAGCGQALFSSQHKYDSGTGWPSFYQPIDQGAVGSKTDYKLIVARTEVHCSRCGGHLGHVFSDGPKPTGERYCINGVSLKFEDK